eukprot:TRINITY_DN27024_c0_g1_i1.p2 TRINITY_DN27024_c0_g1~~TRINITY_DN27024_c0_g1_i1.p2  ORF type:complete len:257 (+),score=40.26 TRINITY_DN27024_c0_g1_i1:68-772(+)
MAADPVRRCGTDLLSQGDREVLAACAARHAAAASEAFHLMIWGRGVDEDGSAGADGAACAVARRLVAELLPHLGIVSIRMLYSPPGCPAQQWHLDFAQDFGEVRTIFVGVTSATADNCTELLRFGSGEADLVAKARGTGRPLPRAEWSAVPHSIVPVEMAQWETVVLHTSHCFHRRGANHSGATRVTFNIDCAPVHAAPGWQCVDSMRSLHTGRVCPRAQIDELSEQDCFLSDT